MHRCALVNAVIVVTVVTCARDPPWTSTTWEKPSQAQSRPSDCRPMDRLGPIVRFKAGRENTAAQQLAAALLAQRAQEIVVERERERQNAARPDLQSAALVALMDLADSRSRVSLKTALAELEVVERAVADVSDSHRQASMERQVLERVRDRRLQEHNGEVARKERRSFDAIAARRYR